MSGFKARIQEVYDDRNRLIGFSCQECGEQAAYMSLLVHKENCSHAKGTQPHD